MMYVAPYMASDSNMRIIIIRQYMYIYYIYIYVILLLLLLSDLGNASVIIEAVLLIETITPYIYTSALSL